MDWAKEPDEEGTDGGILEVKVLYQGCERTSGGEEETQRNSILLNCKTRYVSRLVTLFGELYTAVSW
jgi:hypothetical protein